MDEENESGLYDSDETARRFVRGGHEWKVQA